MNYHGAEISTAVMTGPGLLSAGGEDQLRLQDNGELHSRVVARVLDAAVQDALADLPQPTVTVDVQPAQGQQVA